MSEGKNKKVKDDSVAGSKHTNSDMLELGLKKHGDTIESVQAEAAEEKKEEEEGGKEEGEEESKEEESKEGGEEASKES